MNKNGFTLIELIGVIVILAALLLVIIPNVTDSTQRGVEEASEQSKESAELAAKNWASDHRGSLPSKGNTKNVTISELQNGGYIDINDEGKLQNGDKLDGCVVIENTTPDTATKNTYTYTYKDNC